MNDDDNGLIASSTGCDGDAARQGQAIGSFAESSKKIMVKRIDNTQPRQRPLYGEGNSTVSKPPDQEQHSEVSAIPSSVQSRRTDSEDMIPAGVLITRATQAVNNFPDIFNHCQNFSNNLPARLPYAVSPRNVYQTVTAAPAYTERPYYPVSAPIPTLAQGYREEPINATVEIIATVIGDPNNYYRCKITCARQPPIIKEIPAEKFADGQWLRKIPCFHSSLNKAATNKFLYRYLNDLINAQGQRNIEYVFEKPGWQTVGHAHVYATPEGVIGKGDDHKAKSKVGQRFGQMLHGQYGDLKRFLEFTRLTPDSWIAAIILLYDVLSFAWQLFYDAGWMVKFLVMIKGSSGVFKTSIAKLLTQVENTQTTEYHLSSTGAGMTLGFAPFRHAILLLDDLTPSSGADTIKAVENVLRAFGDGTGRQRDVSGAEGKFRKAEGGCLITAEVNPFEGSSLARMLVLPLSAGDVDVSVLTNLQKDPPLASFMFGFIQYLSEHYGELVMFIRERGDFYNSISVKYSHSRFREYRIQLLIAKDVLLRFGSVTLQLSAEECDQRDKYFTGSVEQAIQYNSGQYKAQTPTEMICSAIVYAIECGFVRIVPMGTTVDKGKLVALDEGNSLYLKQKDLVPIVDKFCRDYGLNTAKYTNTALASLLVSAGVALQFMEGNQPRKGTKLPGYGNTRYMKINKEKLYNNADYESAE